MQKQLIMRDRFVKFIYSEKATKFCEISTVDLTSTGKSLSEALIFASTNPQYDDRLFIELCTSLIHENSKLRTWGEHEENMLCTHIVFLF